MYGLGLEARRPKSRCGQGAAGLLPGPPLASGGLLVICGVPWFVDTSPFVASLSARHLPVCTPVSTLPVLQEYGSPLQYDLILTRHICGDPNPT